MILPILSQRGFKVKQSIIINNRNKSIEIIEISKIHSINKFKWQNYILSKSMIILNIRGKVS